MTASLSDPLAVRNEIVERLAQDLIGPADINEVLTERPTDRYLTGILYPPEQRVPEDDADEASEEAGGAEAGEPFDRGVGLSRTLRPSSLGLSFRVSGASPAIQVSISLGRYEIAAGGETHDPTRSQSTWQRIPCGASVEIRFDRDEYVRDQLVPGIDGLAYSYRAVRTASHCDVTLVLTNVHRVRTASRTASEEATFFQTGFRVTALAESAFAPRGISSALTEDDALSGAVLYRDLVEYAAGHTCAAEWFMADAGGVGLATTWLPRSLVPAVSSEGSEEFHHLGQEDWTSQTGLQPRSARWLAGASPSDLHAGLAALVESYEAWTTRVEAQIAQVAWATPAIEARAHDHMAACRRASRRMRDGIDSIATEPNVRTAFQLAQRAMWMQYTRRGDVDDLQWRPFQLGFQLLTLSSVAFVRSDERDTMDLLWFPTGGGKTEAYLGLIAFTLFYRRLRNDDPNRGAGLGVLIRYTLRVLTAQQFERAAALVAACERIRRENKKRLGSTMFRIGLWVGQSGTPNSEEDARKNPERLRVLTNCPACDRQLTQPTSRDLRPRCRNTSCVFSNESIPVDVIDDFVYQERPSVLIGTVDKFAQITREPRTATLFSIQGPHDAPDLILQDELHLISGPLGTITGVYEIAIDALCSRDDRRPKVIGSTATIQRAQSQVRALFDREVFQFPPPGIDADDSGFAKVDYRAPGRQYVGITSAGRSPKFTLQAIAASLQQSPLELSGSATPAAIDPYWTLVAYFNALRELGGALVLFEDDVRRSIDAIAERRGAVGRELNEPTEITSRVPGEDIRRVLDDLQVPYPDEALDTVLASNMISVGVDVPRLGLMLVNGQPKTNAEYIQATSRVGRGATPGLVVVAYNASRPRDRSRFESFATWHQSLYRNVEASSVTPFASRARDRAMHAALVALSRLMPGQPVWSTTPRLTLEREQRVRWARDVILSRVRRIDPAEHDAAAAELDRLIDTWRERKNLDQWWWNRWQQERIALLISAEDQASMRAVNHTVDAWETPNSMREVEPSVQFRFTEGLRRDASSGE